jgi:acyl-CoA dehydrogenase
MSLVHRQSATDPSTDWSALMEELGSRFAARAADYDAADAFVAENFAELKQHRTFAAGVPRELGGGGASYPELCSMLRILARYCGSTALALSMHTHMVATAAWRWRREPNATEALLRRVVDERLVLVTSGASDYLNASGTAMPTDGGWRINAKKIFASGSPFGDLLMTQAVYHDPKEGPTVLHFAIPLRSPNVKIEDTWRVLGMRATGSHDVSIHDEVVADSAISLRRPAGRWIPLFHLLASIPLPLIYAVYLGVAESAREIALSLARKRPKDPGTVLLVGQLENELAIARMAHRDMVEAVASCEQPGPETTNRIFIGRGLLGRAVTRVAEKAMEVGGGSSFYRAAGLERLFRDLQGARFHRPQEQVQLRLTGRLALGLDFDS